MYKNSQFLTVAILSLFTFIWHIHHNQKWNVILGPNNKFLQKIVKIMFHTWIPFPLPSVNLESRDKAHENQ